MKYPVAIYLRNIKPSKRVCCQCGGELLGYGHFMFTAIQRGKYLCRDCASPKRWEVKETPVYDQEPSGEG